MTERITTIELDVIAEPSGAHAMTPPALPASEAPPPPPSSVSQAELLGLSDLRDRYELLAKLGSGGMADVFLAVQSGSEHLERFAVLKRMRALSELRDSATRMFTNEARVIASLNHPHIVKVFDFGHLDGDVAIAMEYVDGESLEALQQDLRTLDESVPVPVALKLLTEAAEALHYAHAATGPDGRPLHLIHRDIGPQNLLLTGHGYLKVIDFGVAKTAVNPAETTPGLVKGKMPYFAPETLTGPTVDGRADLYALGLVMYELLTLERAHPFKTDASIAEVVERITTVQLPRVSELDRRIPDEIADVVIKATALKPADRYQTGAEFAAAIRNAGDRTSGVATTAEVEDWFQSTFTERYARRRAFERRALERKIVDAANRQTRVLQSQPELTPVAPTPNRPRRRWMPVAMFAAVLIGLLGGTALAYMLFASEPAATELARAPSANVYVHSEPADASVVIDGHILGSTGGEGLYLYLVPGQVHELSVEKAGFESYRLEVSGEEFGLRRIVAKLSSGRPAVAGVETEAGTPVATLQSPRREPRRRSTTRRKTTVAPVVAAPPKEKPGRAAAKAKASSGLTPQPAAPATEEAPVPAPVEEEAPPAEPAPVEVAEATVQTAAPVNTASAVISAAPTAAEPKAQPSRPRRDPLPVIPVQPSSTDRVAPTAPVSAPVVARAPVAQSTKALMARRSGGQSPKYPRRELEEGITGTVTVKVRLGPDGRVAEHEIVSGPRAFRKAVDRVIGSWTFKPHLVRGQPVQTTGTLKIDFQVGR